MWGPHFHLFGLAMLRVFVAVGWIHVLKEWIPSHLTSQEGTTPKANVLKHMEHDRTILLGTLNLSSRCGSMWPFITTDGTQPEEFVRDWGEISPSEDLFLPAMFGSSVFSGIPPSHPLTRYCLMIIEVNQRLGSFLLSLTPILLSLLCWKECNKVLLQLYCHLSAVALLWQTTCKRNAFRTCGKVVSRLWLDEEISVWVFHAIDSEIDSIRQ